MPTANVDFGRFSYSPVDMFFSGGVSKVGAVMYKTYSGFMKVFPVVVGTSISIV